MVLTLHYKVKKVLDHQTSLEPEPIWPTCQGDTLWRHYSCAFSPEVYIRFEEWCFAVIVWHRRIHSEILLRTTQSTENRL